MVPSQHQAAGWLSPTPLSQLDPAPEQPVTSRLLPMMAQVRGPASEPGGLVAQDKDLGVRTALANGMAHFRAV